MAFGTGSPVLCLVNSVGVGAAKCDRGACSCFLQLSAVNVVLNARDASSAYEEVLTAKYCKSNDGRRALIPTLLPTAARPQKQRVIIYATRTLTVKALFGVDLVEQHIWKEAEARIPSLGPWPRRRASGTSQVPIEAQKCFHAISRS